MSNFDKRNVKTNRKFEQIIQNKSIFWRKLEMKLENLAIKLELFILYYIIFILYYIILYYIKFFTCIVMLRILNLSYINGKSNDLYLRRNMCIVMLRILNLSYINGKSNDLYLRRNQQEIRSTIISFFL